MGCIFVKQCVTGELPISLQWRLDKAYACQHRLSLMNSGDDALVLCYNPFATHVYVVKTKARKDSGTTVSLFTFTTKDNLKRFLSNNRKFMQLETLDDLHRVEDYVLKQIWAVSVHI